MIKPPNRSSGHDSSLKLAYIGATAMLIVAVINNLLILVFKLNLSK